MNLAPTPTNLPDWIASVVRPHADDGVLWTARAEPTPAGELRVGLLPAVTGHVKSVCGWPRPSPDAHWMLGDYSFYALTVEVDEAARAYVQIWSEPEDPVLIEVSSGHWQSGLASFLTPAREERLRNRGFSIGGAAQNWQKRVVIDAACEAERIARELLDVLLAVLDYDGTRELRFNRTLERRARAGWVHEALNRAMLVRVMSQVGYLLEHDPELPPNVVLARTPTQRCTLHLSGEQRPGLQDYAVLTLRTVLDCPPELAVHRAQQVNDRYRFVTAQPDVPAGALVLSHALLLEGGVTEQYLRAQLEVWKALLAAVAEP